MREKIIQSWVIIWSVIALGKTWKLYNNVCYYSTTKESEIECVSWFLAKSSSWKVVATYNIQQLLYCIYIYIYIYFDNIIWYIEKNKVG